MKSLHNFIVILKYQMFNNSFSVLLSQFVTIGKLFKSVSIRKSTLNLFTVTSTKDTHQIPNNPTSVPESLISVNVLFQNKNSLH